MLYNKGQQYPPIFPSLSLSLSLTQPLAPACFRLFFAMQSYYEFHGIAENDHSLMISTNCCRTGLITFRNNLARPWIFHYLGQGFLLNSPNWSLIFVRLCVERMESQPLEGTRYIYNVSRALCSSYDVLEWTIAERDFQGTLSKRFKPFEKRTPQTAVEYSVSFS